MDQAKMTPNSYSLLERLLETPGPSGYEQPVQQVVRDFLEPLADELHTDAHGNVIACKNPNGAVRVMLDGHCDQIGLLVTHIDDNGFLYAQAIGGWDPQQLVGQRMTVWTAQGAVPAVIARKAIHLLTDAERKQAVKMDDLWLDIGAESKEEAATLVRVGDPVTLELGMQAMRNRLANAPGMDDRSGLWLVLEAFRRAVAGPLSCALYVVSTVQEEIGLRGARTSAYGIDPHAGIAVDVTHASDCPTVDARYRGEVKLGKGPVIFRGPNMNPVVSQGLIDIAEQGEIPYQVSALGRAAPNDANSIQITRQGVASGLVSIPNRYMHSAVETISLDDLDAGAELLRQWVASVSEETDFTPR